MIFELEKKDYFIIIIVLALFISFDIFYYIHLNSNKKVEGIKKNSINTYENRYITVDRQAAIYLSMYYNLINNDVNKAYELLDDDTKSAFNSVEDFKDYLSNLNISSTKISKFKQYKQLGYSYYDIIDVNGNNFIFKTRGVSKYTVIIK